MLQYIHIIRKYLKFLSKISFLLLFLSIFVNELGVTGDPQTCNKSRIILTDSWGVFSDGPQDYLAESHCEWLIRAPLDLFINLNITSLDTECSYDHLYVYDGATYDSQLLAVFSGSSTPSPLTAKSGAMLILLYSDTNYMRSGFEAVYSITDCMFNCSNNGQCVEHKCSCFPGYEGEGCEIEQCPGDCGSSENRGRCAEDSQGRNFCHCQQNYTGDSCSLNSEAPNTGVWHWVHRNGRVFKPRTSHGTVYFPESDRMMVFGGNDLNEVYDDLIIYNFTDGVWFNNKEKSSILFRKNENAFRLRKPTSPARKFNEVDLEEGKISLAKNLSFSVTDNNTVSVKLKNGKSRFVHRRNTRMVQPTPPPPINHNRTPSPSPRPRFGHCVQSFQQYLVSYGGKLKDGSLTGELWVYDSLINEWKLMSNWSRSGHPSHPPPLAFCTLTAVDKWLYLFGGSLDHGIFSNAIFRLAPTKDWTWEKVRVLGGKDLDVRLVGHTTVFYSGARSLYVYGGIKINIARFSKLSNQLFAFNVDRNYWSEIHYPQGSVDGYPAPLERAFHSSLIAGNYMVVYGGYVHKHKEEELCYDNRLYLFHLGCHVWLSNELTRFNQTDLNAPNSRGVYGHGAFLRGGNTIVVVGGFRGSVTNQVSAYVLPSTLISTDDIPFDGDVACRAHETQSLCVLNLECGWCATDGVCYDRSKSSSCITNLQTSSCPGLCSTLSTCQSCLIHSRDGECGWCVKARKCLSRPSSFNKIICGSSHLSQGWWGSHDQLLTSLDECISKDIPAGLVFMQYKEPTNYSQPDNVRIITDINRDLRSPVDSRDPLDPQSSFMSKYRLKGFLHPFQMEYFSFNKLYNYMEPLRLILKGYNLNATLFLSSDDSESNLQKVAYVIDGRIPSSEATRIDGDPLMSNFNRHLFQLDISPAHLTLNSTFNLSLIWRFGSQDPSSLTVQNLEPFGLGENCAKYSNCLACMSDYMCGWYNPHSACIPRNYTGHYAMLIGGQQLIWDSALCDQCEDFITCEDCLRFSHCEWVVEKAHCTRRGRYGSAVRERAECPIPCHLRNSCRSCLGDPGLCAWCETSKECFLFSVYTSYFQYGACRVWKDEDHLNTSRIEASAKLFKSIVDFDDVNGSPSNVAKEDGMCVICEVNSDCESCLAQIECGWCHSEYDPKRGLCTRGSFDKPYRGDCAVLMERTLSRRNAFVPAPSLSNRTKVNWAYASCPDVDECQLFLHDCHPNASCVNTDGGYSCVCPRGFTGNGKISCERTCYEDCVHGKCSGGPDFKCECNLGWTGPDCSVNCGCNNHSTCKKVGECNHCQGETTGKFCELCKSGSYGNATTVGCTKCSCNGHWDEARGRCDRVTGECFCVHNTFGRNCDMCRKGFYGDPRNGGHCYRECTSRGLVVNATRGHFGSKNVHEPGMEACLWIISAHSSLTPPRSVLKGSHIIQVLIEKNEIDCGLGALFVYEGIPSFISMKPSADQQNLIGVFCKGHASFPLAVEAKSGIMTVFYEKISSDQEFLASYEALTCPRNPGKNRHCFFDKPVCKDGWKDVDCSLPVCPNKCSEGKGRGRCDVTYGRCLCHPNYVGEDCSIRRQNHMVILEELFNPLKISASFSHLHKVLPRFSHTLIVDHQGSLWVFGGYSLSRGPLNDIQRFDTRNKTWSQITVNVHPGVHPPPQRYFHAASYVDSYNEMYVYGGKNKTHFLADFWKFSILSESWTLLSVRENLPPLAGHTLTYKGESNAYSLVLIGGISSDQGFLEEVWEYDVLRYRWQRLVTRGARPIGIYGHSTVYHESTHSFYIYGGYVYGSEGISLNNHLYALDYLKKKWSVLPPDGKINHNPASRPAPRAFHAAVSTEQYLVLISGLIMDRLSSNQDLLVYSYKCNMWIPLNNHFITVAGHDLATPLLGVSAAMFESSIYVVGGISGRAHGSVIKITIPQDLCTLNANKTQCRDRIGCANCVIYDERGTNTSFCYSNVQPEPSTCLRPHGKLTSVKGIQCDSIIFEDRECYQYKTCSQCLASWPSYPDAKQLCQWCFGCRKGKCIPQTSSCADDSACSGYEEYVMYSSKYTTDIDLCPEYLCPTSSCERCHEFSHCAWSNGYLNNNEYKHTKHLSRTPPQDSWKCVNMSMENNVEGWSSSKVCPKPCHIHRTCDTCLKVPQCMWSTTHRKCISSLIVFLDCLGGTCGRLIEDTKQCPPTCNIFSQCNHCLSQAHCGWCSVSTEVGGLGICTEGLMEAPLYGRCRDLDYSVITLNATLRTIFKFDLERFSKESEKQEMISWHFEKCPPEDECLNQHHTCNSRKEVCENRFDGYVCRCAPGYQMNDDNFCAPVCDQGCLFGKCVDPNKCICDFGYVGYNCSVKCQCNGHSNCPGPDRLTECFECHNNTIGAQCQQCKPNFVGNPLKNEKCKSCLEYCYGHTSICVSQTRMDMLNNTQSDISIIKKIDLISEEEPMTDAVCLQCEHMTTGSRCDSCVLGYFRGTTDRTAPCRACQCNGHGSICNADFGTYCDCKNNTETPCEERMRGIHSKEEAKDCSKEQCSKCKEPFLGKPTDGHQCYRQMSLEKEFCLDPITQDECYSIPSALPKGKAIFFAIRPKFNNVDIRLFVDIAKGGVDVHITTFMEGFTVTVNNSNWEHKVQIDRAYPITKQDYYADLQKHRTRLFSPRYDLIGASAYLSKLGVQRLLTNHNSSFNRFLSSQYYKYTVPAKGLHTYFKMSNPNHFLVVKNLTDRLIVTLPKQRHNLTEAKFYIVILGVGLGDTSDSYGSIFFRQDQPRIDLFVFFSVFFSCFFLFLALCVVVWKVKQGIDHRRARQRHVVEMLHMAKRPFSSTTLVLDLPEFELSCEAAVRSPVRRKRACLRKDRICDRFEVSPVALEPTEDGVAAVATVVLQMPGIDDRNAEFDTLIDSPPQRLALGSVLCLVSRVYPSTSRAFQLRRRTSHL